MNYLSLILFCVIWSPPSLGSQTSSWNEELLVRNSSTKALHQYIQHQKQQINHNASYESRSNGITDPRPPWRNAYMSHKHRHLRTVHGTVNIIGWGVLVPVGALVARYLRKASNEWYSLHIVSQLSGFILGTLGWGLGISIKNSAKEHIMSTHGILGTIIFAFAALQPDEEHVCRKYWVVYHNFAGYALIVLIIANIFQGINNQSAAKRWEWIYGVILGILGMSAIALELLRWTSK